MKGFSYMKKLVCFSLILFSILGCLTACNVSQSINGIKDSAEATPKVEEMMNALAEEKISDAKALMHPQASEKADTGFVQMQTYLAGRKVAALNIQNINITSSVGTAGKARQEQLAYKATLEDGEVVYLNVVYLSNDKGDGFVSFQLVLGAI